MVSKDYDALNRLESLGNMGTMTGAFDNQVTMRQGQCFAGRLPVNNCTGASGCVANFLRHGR
jgi:hypothetical protein